MTFEFSLTRKIKATQGFVFDWWTDLTPEDTRLVKPLKKREIISKTANLIVLRDEEQMYWKRMQFEIRVTLERPERWVSVYDGKAARARSEYNLSSEQDGTTTLHYKTRIEPKGFLTSAFSPIVEPFVKRVFADEMKTFIQSLEEDYLNSEKLH